MKDPALIGTSEYPLRASQIQQAAKCSWRLMSTYLFAPEDRAGPAADTGSAAHAAIHHWHSDSHNVLASVEAMHAQYARYPLADLDEAVRMFVAYTKDPRNRDAVVIGSEQYVRVQIKPSPDDRTGQPIIINGRFDQVRERNGAYYLDDLKTSKRDGITLMGESLYQLCVYAVGASLLYNRPVHPGAIISLRKYLVGGVDPSAAPPGVFWNYTIRYENCDMILNGLRHIVAALRCGIAWANAGDYCTWCHYHGIDNCIPALVQVGKLECASGTLSTRNVL